MNDVTDRHEETNRPQKSHLGLILAVAAVLVAGNVYFLWSNSQLQTKLNRVESGMQAELSLIRENSAAAATATAKTLDELRAQVDETRGQALQAATQANKTARRHADDLIKQVQSEQQKTQEQVASAIGEVKEAANTANSKVADVMTRVTTVDTQVSQSIPSPVAVA